MIETFDNIKNKCPNCNINTNTTLNKKGPGYTSTENHCFNCAIKFKITHFKFTNKIYIEISE